MKVIDKRAKREPANGSSLEPTTRGSSGGKFYWEAAHISGRKVTEL